MFIVVTLFSWGMSQVLWRVLGIISLASCHNNDKYSCKYLNITDDQYMIECLIDSELTIIYVSHDNNLPCYTFGCTILVLRHGYDLILYTHDNKECGKQAERYFQYCFYGFAIVVCIVIFVHNIYVVNTIIAV